MNKTKKNPIFTVIIPTKDRANYLYYTLKTCSNQNYDNLEIIVSDDGSIDNTREMVENEAKKDPRIRYISPTTSGKNVGMLDNFEFALNHVKSGYIIALGGDDGLLPNSIAKMNDIIEETGLELLTWPTAAFFYENTRSINGQLIIPIKNGKPHIGLRIIKSKTFLERQAKELFYVADIESPMFYVKGVASTSLVDKVKSRSKDGKFYSCSTPDGFSGIVLAGEVESFAFSGEPLSIHGVSPTSQGLGYLGNDEDAIKQSEAFFKNVAQKPMHSELASQPYSPLISLMTADFLLTARDLKGWPGEFSPINYKNLLSKGLAELEDGLFSEERVERELKILFAIADHQGELNFFFNKVNNSKRNARKTLEGNAISAKQIYLDASNYGIKNIFDASYFVYNFHQIFSKIRLKTIYKTFINSVKYFLLSKQKTKNTQNK